MMSNAGNAPPDLSSSGSLTVSVVVPTRNRPEHAEACALSILATTGFLDLTFVDQSDDFKTQEALSRITEYWPIILGPLILLVVLYARGGIDGLLARRGRG